MTRPWLSLVAACAIVVLAVGLVVSSAQRPPSPGRAAALTSTDPADGAALVRAPSGVELSFTVAPDPDLSHVSVRDGSGTALDAGRLRLVQPERLRQPIHGTAAPPDGSVDVTVSYHVIFTDGRELAGTLHFSVGIRVAAGPGAAREPSTVDAATDADASAKADAAGNAEVAAGSAHQHGVDPVSAALLAIDGVVALAVVVLLLRRPPPQPSRPPS
ncbi:MAG TPA: copper resistance protein CopC [Kribbellaceae bacterium]